jgi:hypothetical protein
MLRRFLFVMTTRGRTARTLILAMVGMAAFASDTRAAAISTFGYLSIGYTGGVWNINFSPGSASGVFAPLGGTAAAVSDLNFSAVSVGVPTSVPNFVTFAADPTRTITLNTVSAGSFSALACFGAPAAGQSCTPAGSAYSFLNQTADSSSMSVSINGTLVDSATGGQTPITGTLTTQFADMSYQEVLAVLSGGGSLLGSYSTEFATVTPNPQSFSLGGTLAFSNGGVDFQGTPVVAGFADNRFLATAPSTGVFGPLVGTAGTTQDVNPLLTGLPFLMPDFMQFDADPTLSFDLEFVSSGTAGFASCFAAPAIGQTCTPPLSAFNFANIGSFGQISSTGAFGISGTVNTATGSALYNGFYTLQFAGESYQQVLASLLLQDGTVSAAYSAQFVTEALTPTPIPEPSTLLMLGSTLLALRWRLRRSL